MEIFKYRLKPQLVDAIQWTGDNFDNVQRFTEALTGKVCFIPLKASDRNEVTGKLWIRDYSWGAMCNSDWIVHTKETGFYSIKDVVFKKNYEVAIDIMFRPIENVNLPE